MSSRIPDEQPPQLIEDDAQLSWVKLREWLSRIVHLMNAALGSVNDFDPTESIPDKVQEGMMRYFANIDVPNGITFPGPYWYTDGAWRPMIADPGILSINIVNSVIVFPWDIVFAITASGTHPNQNDYLNFGSNQHGGSPPRWVVPSDNCELLGATIGRTDSDDATIEVLVNGIVIASFFTDATETKHDFNVAVGELDYVEVRVANGSNRLSNPVVQLFFVKRGI